MKKYLKQLPWLLLFYGIFIASDWIWQELWRYLIKRGSDWIINLVS